MTTTIPTINTDTLTDISNAIANLLFDCCGMVDDDLWHSLDDNWLSHDVDFLTEGLAQLLAGCRATLDRDLWERYFEVLAAYDSTCAYELLLSLKAAKVAKAAKETREVSKVAATTTEVLDRYLAPALTAMVIGTAADLGSVDTALHTLLSDALADVIMSDLRRTV